MWVLGAVAVTGTGGAAWSLTVTGEVYDVRSGKVVPNAEVAVSHEKTHTAADGTYRLVGVTDGPWHLTAIASGYGATVIKKTAPRESASEIWLNVPLLPAKGVTAGGRDFRWFFFNRAPLYERGGRFVIARRIPELTLSVEVKTRNHEDAAAAAARLNSLNDTWGMALIEVRAEGEADNARVIIDFDADKPYFEIASEGEGRVDLPGGATESNLVIAQSFIRQLLLSGGAAGKEIGLAALQVDAEAAADLDAVITIIYREREEFDYGVFRPRVPSPLTPLADIFFGVGGYSNHGARRADGTPGQYPIEYQLGQVYADVGVAWRGLWGRGGWGFAGIWGSDAEAAASPDNPAADVVLRNYVTDIKAGYAWKIIDSIRLGPHTGYRWLTVRGKYEAGAATPAVTDFNVTTEYFGPEAGARFNCSLPWYGIGFNAEYARVVAEPQYNWLEFGGGAVNRAGIGSFAYVRIYWGSAFKYTYGGLALKFDVPMWR